MAQLYVKVETEQAEFSIDCSGSFPRISLESPASQGRANRELVRRLSEILGRDVGIVSGHRSRRKKIAVNLEKEEVVERLKDW